MRRKLVLIGLLVNFGVVQPGSSFGEKLGGVWDSISSFFANLIASSEQKALGPAREKYNLDNPYRETSSNVRTGTALSQEEQLFLQQRQALVVDALRKHFGVSRPLKIAICGSGGGYRAMIYSLGALIGAQNIGLLDCATYLAGLSGSTWTIGAWMAQGASLDQLKQDLKLPVQVSNLIGQGLPKLITDPVEIEKVARNLAIKLLFKQPLSIVALWGAVIANTALVGLRDQAQLVTLSSQKQLISQGQYPLPIYTAVCPLPVVDQANPQYHWVEFTPYEVGSAEMQAFVPSWGFGRKYINGQARGFQINNQRQFEPEMPFSYGLGIFGSAFEIDLCELTRDMHDQLQKQPLEAKALSVVVKATNGDDRLMPAEVRNPVYKLVGHPQADQKHLTLVDAGLAFNLPLPPLLRPERGVDVLVIVDASADVQGACELRKAEGYAREHQLKFPKIDYQGIDSRIVSIFSDLDVTVPIVIYLPMFNDRTLPDIRLDQVLRNFDPQACLAEGPCSTFNFSYTGDQFERLCRLGQRNMELARSQISDALVQRVRRLRLK